MTQHCIIATEPGLFKMELEQDIINIMDLFKANKLTLNLNKTECLVFHPSGKSTKIELNLERVFVVRVTF